MIFKNNRQFYDTRVTPVDNEFIADYLTSAPENAVRVYLYGLYLSGLEADEANTLDAICRELSLSADEVKSCIEYWADAGAMEIISTSPFVASYLPLSLGRKPQKKYNKTKYADFNEELRGMFPLRDILPAEYDKYYAFVEENKIQPELLLMIIAFCVKYQGTSVKQPYILSVATDWVINEKLTTLEQIENKLSLFDKVSDGLKDICYNMGINTDLSVEARKYYVKWTSEWNFTKEAIVFCATNFKIKTLSKLDSVLSELKTSGISTSEDLQEYKIRRDSLFDTAKKIAKRLGKHLERYDYVVENFVSKWFDMGYSSDAVLLICHNAALLGNYSFERLDAVISELFSAGIITDDQVVKHYDVLTEKGIKAQNILTAAGISRPVLKSELDAYNIWTSQWGFNYDELILIANLAKGKSHCFSFLTNLLGKAHDAKITTAEGVESLYKALYDKKVDDKVTINIQESDIRERIKDINLFDDDGGMY